MSYHFGMRKSTEKYLFIFLYHIFNLYWSQFHPHSKSPLFSAVKKLISYKSFLIAFSTIGPFQLEKKLPIEFECIEYALMEFCSYNRNRKRKMSVTISTCNQICNAPTNQSSAKMLYSFPKQSRFLKRKTLLYLCSHPAAIASMISRAPSLLVELASAMDINMTSLASLPPRHRPIPTTSIARQTTSTDLPLERAERGWWSLAHLLLPFRTRTLGPATMSSLSSVPK